MVLKQPQPIPFEEFVEHVSDFFAALEQQHGVILVEKAGQVYRLQKDYLFEPADIMAGYDPQRVLEGLRRSAGALKGIDREALLRDIREQRAQDSRGRPA